MPTTDQFVPYGKQSIVSQDMQAIIDAVYSGWISQGPCIEKFEEKVANYCGAKYATAVSSGTAALHIAAIAAGLEPGKIFWTSPITFVASANCGLYTGAEVDFVDIDPNTYNLSVEKLEEKLVKAKKENTLPEVLIPVDFAGLSCPMKHIHELACQYGFKIIEDACHALGGDYLGQKIGSCRYTDMTVFSFHPVKSITTGEGGMVLTNNLKIHKRLQRLRSHGITKEQNLFIENHGQWYYEQQELGFNYRISDIQAALGASQMNRLDDFINKRRELVALYTDQLKGLPVSLQMQDRDCKSAHHLCVIRLGTDGCNNFDRRKVFEGLRKAGIGVQVHYIPVPAQPYYRNLGFKLDEFPEAKKYYKEAVTLPLYAELEENNLKRVVSTLKDLLETA